MVMMSWMRRFSMMKEKWPRPGLVMFCAPGMRALEGGRMMRSVGAQKLVVGTFGVSWWSSERKVLPGRIWWAPGLERR